jgi:predicted secreted Zn-dependent protease
VSPADTALYFVAGATGADLYLTIGATGQSLSTLAYELAAPALTGYSLTVAQIGANGPGYPTTLVL